MERLLRERSAYLTILLLASFCFAVLLVTLQAGPTANAARSVAAVADAPIQKAVLPDPYAAPLYGSPGVITCTQTYTTARDSIGYDTGNDFSTAAQLAPYQDLSLVGQVGQYQNVRVFTETFRLDNPQKDTRYTVRAVPQQTNNYNLGITVYNDNKQPISITGNPDENPTTYDASVTFVADGSVLYYFVKAYQITQQCYGGTYDLQFSYVDATATPTPTPSNTPLASPTPPGNLPDLYDNPPGSNDTITTASTLNGNSVTGLTLCNQAVCNANVGSDDNDWYSIFSGAGYQYTVNAAPENGYTYPYLFMEIVAPDRTTVIGTVDSSNNVTINWTATTSGRHYIHIHRATTSPTGGPYKITITTNAPTVTPSPTPATPGPADTPVPGLDAYEPNYDFDHAAGIGLNVKITGLNFVPLPGQTVNNDFFRLRVKNGMLVTCETLDLSAGTDTNMILYDNSRNGLAGNDDVDKAHGDLRSRVTVSINYDGFLYILVGQGFAVPPAEASKYTYSLQCSSGAGLSTPTPVPPTSAPYVPAPSVTPAPPPTQPVPPTLAPPPTPMPAISVRSLSTPAPAGPPQQLVTADMRVAYDVNGNGVPDPGEGVVGLPIRVYDDTTGALLAQGFTDETGHAVFSVPAAGPIRVSVPYLSFETVVPPSGAAIPVLISPRGLPEQIP
jgi:hypothetical protein